jgi:hypothetical protein
MGRVALLGVIALAALTVCVTSKPVYTPDGYQGQAINCPGTAGSWNGCFERAGQIFGPKGYDILSKSDENGFVASGNNASTTNNRSMIIKCKGD